MSELIKRQDAIDALEKVAELYPWRVPGDRDSYSKYNEAWNDALDRADSEIEALPSAQPERKKGKWIKHIDDLFPAESTLECNVCHHEQPITIDDNYCPHCGARMEESEE